jgi:hypothetical protein
MKNLIKLGYEVRVNQGVIDLIDNDMNERVARYCLISKCLTSKDLDLYTIEVFIKVINKYESGK